MRLGWSRRRGQRPHQRLTHEARVQASIHQVLAQVHGAGCAAHRCRRGQLGYTWERFVRCGGGRLRPTVHRQAAGSAAGRAITGRITGGTSVKGAATSKAKAKGDCRSPRASEGPTVAPRTPHTQATLEGWGGGSMRAPTPAGPSRQPPRPRPRPCLQRRSLHTVWVGRCVGWAGVLGVRAGCLVGLGCRVGWMVGRRVGWAESWGSVSAGLGTWAV